MKNNYIFQHFSPVKINDFYIYNLIIITNRDINIPSSKMPADHRDDCDCAISSTCDCYRPYKFSSTTVQTFREYEPFMDDKLRSALRKAQIDGDKKRIKVLQRRYQTIRASMMRPDFDKW